MLLGFRTSTGKNGTLIGSIEKCKSMFYTYGRYGIMLWLHMELHYLHAKYYFTVAELSRHNNQDLGGKGANALCY